MGKEEIRNRLQKLKKVMRENRIAVYILPMSDYHGSEYLSDYFKLISYFSGFTGSAGWLVVTEEESFLWTDGRYFIQAEHQLLDTGIRLQKMGEPQVPSISEFILSYFEEKQYGSEMAVGFDGRLVSASFVKKLENLTLVYTKDLASEIWDQEKEKKRPPFPQHPVWILDKKFAGEDTESKLSKIRSDMREKGVDYLLLTTLDDIAWLTNLRGGDIAYNPVFLSYMMITKDDAVLYRKIEQEDIRQYLQHRGIIIRDYETFYEDVAQIPENQTVWVDEVSASVHLVNAIPTHCKKVLHSNPVIGRKAIKNETEVENIKIAHKKDAVAVTKFIYWLKTRVCTGIETATERSAGEYLDDLRKKQEGYLGQSFAPIVAFAEHGAIVHYSADESTDAKLKNHSFLLMDTGGHYLEGTTDITRTVAMGPLSEEQKRHYTAVLQGNIRLADAKFKKGLTGANLDFLAREPLYRLGLDFNHGTGHGVGYLLNVHEGPNGFRMRQDVSGTFEEGMVTSDEPGLYLEGHYGIRLENLIVCKEEKKTEYGQFLGFETLTLVPFDPEAVDALMLTDKDKELLRIYHKKVYEVVAQELEEKEREWLQGVTAAFENL